MALLKTASSSLVPKRSPLTPSLQSSASFVTPISLGKLQSGTAISDVPSVIGSSSYFTVCRIKLRNLRVVKALGTCRCCILDVGAHVRIFYTGFWHHAIVSDIVWSPDEVNVVCGGTVIHYWRGCNGEMDVIETRLADFIDKQGVGAIDIVKYCDNQFYAEDTLSLATRCIGMGKYSVVSSNCEHFATYCKTGSRVSSQANTIKDSAALGGAAIVLGTVAPAVFGAVTFGIGIIAAAGYHYARGSSASKINSIIGSSNEMKASRVVCTRLFTDASSTPANPEILEGVSSDTIIDMKEELTRRLCIGGEWLLWGIFRTYPERFNDDFEKVNTDIDVQQLPSICSLRIMLRKRVVPAVSISPKRRQTLPFPPQELEQTEEKSVIPFFSPCSLFVRCPITSSGNSPLDTIYVTEENDSGYDSDHNREDGNLVPNLRLGPSRYLLSRFASSDSLAGSEWADKSAIGSPLVSHLSSVTLIA